MTDSFIAVLDSGIGGISILKPLTNALPEKRFLYFGDNSNAPYGNKCKKELFEITAKNIDYLKQYNIESIVLGCNTLSVNLLDEIKDYAKLPVFGVFPPIDKISSLNEKTLLLATCATADKYKGVKGLDVVGFKNLANEIENKAFSLDEIDFESNLGSISGCFINKKGCYDTIILGCTHYLFIKNKIHDHFCPRKIISGNDFTLKTLINFYSNQKKQVKHLQNGVLFVGNNAKFNEKFFLSSGYGGSNNIKNIKKNGKKF